MRTNTYRLLRKAEANVTAVLEGTFGRAKQGYNVCNSASAKMLILQGFLEVMKVRKIGKSYKVVTNYRMPLVNHCSYKVFYNTTVEWE